MILTHPIASAALPSSWDASQGPEGWLQYGFTLVIIGGALVSSLMSSYAGESAHRASHALLAQLDSQAARAQGFLETAMPSYVAQALLSRVPDTELTVSCASATVAFIALTRFDELTAQLHPRQLMEVSLASLASGRRSDSSWLFGLLGRPAKFCACTALLLAFRIPTAVAPCCL